MFSKIKPIGNSENSLSLSDEGKSYGTREFYVSNVSFNTTHKNKILAKIYSGQTTCYKIKKLNICGSFINKMYTLLILCKIGRFPILYISRDCTCLIRFKMM